MKRPLMISVTNEGGKARVKITGQIQSWKDSAQNFTSAVEDLVAKGVKDCLLYINSEGGSVFEANDIVNVIKKFPGTITGQGGALVASAATYIAVHCNTFSMPSNGMFMIHKPQTAAYGNVDEIEADLTMLKTLTDIYCKAYAAKTGKSEEDIQKLWQNDCWMGAEDACSKKFVDSVSDEDPMDEATVEALRQAVPTALFKTIVRNQDNHLNTIDQMDKKMLCVVLALADTTPDAEVLAQLSGLKAKAAKVEELEAEITALKAESVNAKVKNLIEGAIANKQITATERPHFEKIAKSDYATAEALINSRPKVTALSQEITDKTTGAPQDRTGWKYKDYAEKDPKALAAMASTDIETFKALFKEHYGMEYEG